MFLKNKKESSILSFLVVSFASFFAVFMLVISIFSFYQVKHQNDSLFDYQLRTAAEVIETVLKIYPLEDDENTTHMIMNRISNSFLNIKNYNKSIGFIVYDRKHKKLLLKTSNLPNFHKNYDGITSTTGFEWVYTNEEDGQKNWYTYTLKTDNGNLITVFANDTIKDKISRQIIFKFALLLASTYIVLIGFIYYILKTALHPLERINKRVAKINPRKNEKLNEDVIPYEIKSIVDQINLLIEKFHETLEREKRFSGDAAHELKTPIAGVKTLVEIALASDDIDEIKQKLERIKSSTNRYSHIIDQLLTLSRIQPNEQVTFGKKLMINKVLESFIAENAIKAIEKNIEIVFYPSQQHLYCYSNDYLLGILFKNLISNAIKYTPNGGLIEISSYQEENNIVVEIKDNGIGVPQENIERIFDRFYRETGTGEEGSGLGLAIVAEIVRLHNGKIFAQNNTNQKGLTITVKIPIDHKYEEN
ncbi:HAMP domain-containing histidine kinase [Francisella tularensis subsp. novicida]|uniref:histidine kinase n=2 Tax=Francisella tularensis TaxID=263 RepID=A0A6I4RRN3_FRATU|nr:HAMP domain-containing sensor histidine kinase [Francisella tularensis]ABK90476.1 two-component regulator, sensor histidine kinase [Francisella tularensis subsp. novicida U112]AEE88044.1 sensor kinase [Francisella cf. novicida Fx1]AJI46025.1 his Kinase A domain protein [Francisella tularensis subsp. novicida F6168]AJI61771.1 his Kinase A domain protein [Francisella tularensis subsp. novicida U112]AJI73308.1 his Kinase A domain protein [Francisella tularensis subsp. novicida D9876]